jgi:hypothetical protein
MKDRSAMKSPFILNPSSLICTCLLLLLLVMESQEQKCYKHIACQTSPRPMKNSPMVSTNGIARYKGEYVQVVFCFCLRAICLSL